MWMNGKDAAWNQITAPGPLPSDGFIDGPGQIYPRAQQDRLIREGDSHVGTTKSGYVWIQLREALQDDKLFNLKTRDP